MSTINPWGKEIVSVEGVFGGRPITLEVNRLAFQASAAVTVKYGDAVVVGLTMVGKSIDGMDFFPLTIEYEEKLYASGKISGSRFMKREGKPSDEAILAGRIIDRPIRPLFPKKYRNEVQCISTIYSADPTIRHDVLGLLATSASLMLSGAPFEGPVAGIHVGIVDGKMVAYPTREQLESSEMDLVVAGTKDAIMMVEAGAKEVSEELVAEALQFGHKEIQDIIKLQEELIQKLNVNTNSVHEQDSQKYDEVEAQVSQFFEGKLGENVRGKNQEERDAKVKALWEELHDKFEHDDEFQSHYGLWREVFEDLLKKEVRRAILEENIRPDYRGLEDIRTISSEVGILPRAHGSSIFTRGSTQALNIVTLAPLSFSQTIESMEDDIEKTFIHHYNMPGYASGEVKRLGSPGRREIGHGALAERALLNVMPSVEEFPYTVRTVSEILSSNGSTSMASVCSGCLALMDAGVPLKAPVSGIAMGLIGDGKGTFKILSDIQGLEDFAGDMDFKVAGTEKGITALQMDIKIHGISPELMAEALQQAKRGRAKILNSMLETLDSPRKEMSEYAPRVEIIHINPDKIGMVIGKGGENIQNLTKETGTTIDISDDGSITIASPDKAKIEDAKARIQAMTEEPEVGKIYSGKVVKLMEFGAFVNILPGVDGMVHISAIKNERVEKIGDVLKEGQMVKVKLVAIDDRGKLSLSMKDIKQD